MTRPGAAEGVEASQTARRLDSDDCGGPDPASVRPATRSAARAVRESVCRAVARHVKRRQALAPRPRSPGNDAAPACRLKRRAAGVSPGVYVAALEGIAPHGPCPAGLAIDTRPSTAPQGFCGGRIGHFPAGSQAGPTLRLEPGETYPASHPGRDRFATGGEMVDPGGRVQQRAVRCAPGALRVAKKNGVTAAVSPGIQLNGDRPRDSARSKRTVPICSSTLRTGHCQRTSP
jgi:hypothetical protein